MEEMEENRIEESMSEIEVAVIGSVVVTVRLYRVRRARLTGGVFGRGETEMLGILGRVKLHAASQPLDPDIAVLVAEALRTAAAWAKSRTTCPPVA